MRSNRYAQHGFDKRDRKIQEHRIDPYQLRWKPKEPAVCPGCGAVFHEGRWQWLARPEGAHDETCAACRRIEERMPAGFVTLSGAFLKAHRAEILGVVRNEGERMRHEHPMDRIMEVKESDDVVEVTTTDIHLARRIGDALEDAYDGNLDFHYNEQEYLLRVHWER